MNQNIVFFGSGEYTIPIIDVLKKHGLILAVTTEKSGQLINYLNHNNIPVLSTDLKNDNDIRKISDMKPTIGILASYGEIVPKFLIHPPVFDPEARTRRAQTRRAGGSKFLILNIHPSLLPKYKGPSPIQTAVLNGDKQTGATVIKLDEQIDHGPIIMQEKFDLTGDETFKDLTHKLFAKGAQMIDTILTKIENGETIRFTEQDHSNESFTQKITKQSGFVDINNPPDPTILGRMTRAFHPWPGVWTEFQLYGKTRRIKLLPQNKLQVEGKKIMTPEEFLNGYQKEGREFLSKLSL